MKLRSLAIRRRRVNLDDVVAAYRIWRHEAAAVHGAYRRWLCAPSRDAFEAFAAYRWALDCEELAAQAYARVLHRARHLRGLDLVSHLGQLTVETGYR